MKLLIGTLLLFITQLAVAQNNSLLFEISKKGSPKSYVYGTMHIIPDTAYYFPAKVEKIVSKSDALVLEMTDFDATKLKELMQLKSGTAFDCLNTAQKDSCLAWGATLLKTTPEKFEALFAPQHPFALLQLDQQYLLSARMKMTEFELMGLARKDEKALLGLETLEQQLGFFSALDSTAMNALIMSMVRTPNGKGMSDYLSMVRIYQQKNIDSLSAYLTESGEILGDNEILLSNRNKAWIPKMVEDMKQQTCFFAVGAAHLCGENGVLQLLRNEGYTVTPISY